MSVAMILLPLFVHVLVLFVLLFGRQTGSAQEPAPAAEVLPSLLFAVLSVLALLTRKTDIVFLVLAWVFVLTDLTARVPQLVGPALRERGFLPLVPLVALAIAWGWFAFAILANI